MSQPDHRPLAVAGSAELAHLARLRVTGVLDCDAQICSTTGRPTHALLLLDMRPARGLPYSARVDLGTDPADHLRAHAELPLLRRGALVSVAADALELQADHGHAVLRLINARGAVVFAGPTRPAPPTPPQEG